VEKAKNYVKEIISDLRENKVPTEKVVIRTQLTKKITEYTAIGPHVATRTKNAALVIVGRNVLTVLSIKPENLQNLV